jgi:hypothetical protein
LTGSSKGEDSWKKTITFTGPLANNALAGYVSSGTYVYANETLAKDACTARVDCNGVTQEPKNYTLRAGSTLTGSSNGEVSWKKVTGFIRKVRVKKNSGSVNLKEVQVFDQNGINVALNKIATQSGNGPAGVSHPASEAVNGIVTDFGSLSGYQAGKYFIYQLQQPMYIYRFIQYILTCFVLYIKVHGGRWTWEQM